MKDRFSRTEMLIGNDALVKLRNSRVAVFGIGGVGGYIAEALVRAGVGALDLIDNDTVSESNINRQIIALTSTVGMLKTEVMEKRLLDINPEAEIRCINRFVLPENIDEFNFSAYSYVADAIDTISGKLAIIEKAYSEGIPVISSMGTGNKLDPTKFEITDIYKTSVCPLARVMRYELKKRGVKKLKVLYSKEEPVKPSVAEINEKGKAIPGSISFVPPAAGLIVASEIIKDLTK